MALRFTSRWSETFSPRNSAASLDDGCLRMGQLGFRGHMLMLLSPQLASLSSPASTRTPRPINPCKCSPKARTIVLSHLPGNQTTPLTPETKRVEREIDARVRDLCGL
jgi:hypothetical protein